MNGTECRFQLGVFGGNGRVLAGSVSPFVLVLEHRFKVVVQQTGWVGTWNATNNQTARDTTHEKRITCTARTIAFVSQRIVWNLEES